MNPTPRPATDRTDERSELLPAEEAAPMAAADPSAQPDAVVVTRSEEQLRLGTIRRPVERVRVRKVIVTEEVTMSVTVRREELVVERLPVEMVGVPQKSVESVGSGDPTEADEVLLHELVLREEVPVVQMQVTARERVRLVKLTHTDHQVVTEQLRAERIDIDGASDRPTDPPAAESTQPRA